MKLIIPKGEKLLPFQESGVTEQIKSGKRYIYNADDMGCISGQAIISYNRAGVTNKVTLEELYNKYKSGRWRKDIKTRVKANCDGELRLHNVSDILYSGVKTTYTLTVDSGKTIRATGDHEFLTPTGYVRLDQLRTGSSILTNGKPTCKTCGSTVDIIKSKRAKNKGHCRQCSRTTLRKGYTGKAKDKDGYIRVYGMESHPNSVNGHYILEHRLVMERYLGRLLTREEVVHHINHIKDDNRIDNLQVLTKTEHGLLHKEKRFHLTTDSHGNDIVWKPRLDKVHSIEEYGKERVYDLVMEDPYRNFVVDKFIVHNCGKTVQALTYANSTASKQVLIICPAVVILNWARESNKWFTMKPGTVAKPILQGKDIGEVYKNNLVGRVWKPSPFIISYSMLVRNKKVRDYVTSQDWDLAILDEFHECKNIHSKRSSIVCTEVWPKCKRVYMLSGTPLTNSSLDLFPFFNRVLEDCDSYTRAQIDLCSDYDEFAGTFCYKWVHKVYGTNYKGIRNKEQLKVLLNDSHMFYRRRKSAVLQDLPDKVYHRVDLNLKVRDTTDSRTLTRFLNSFEVDKTDDNTTPTPIMKLRRLLGEAKATSQQTYDYLEDLIDNYNKPLVIAAHHKTVIKTLMQRLRKYNPVLIDGSVNAKGKQEAVDLFQSGESDVFIGNIKAAGVGITLTRSCDVVFVEYAFLPHLNEQFVDRTHRIGQKNNVTAHYLIADHPFDKQLVTSMITKQKAISQVVE